MEYLTAALSRASADLPTVLKSRNRSELVATFGPLEMVKDKRVEVSGETITVLCGEGTAMSLELEQKMEAILFAAGELGGAGAVG